MSAGKILLVGFGPGAEEHMTGRAKSAIAQSDVVIGYKTYIRLIEDLLDGKEVLGKGMTEEIERCREAYNRAMEGKTVALVSSGDIGVYGMAGPFFELLRELGWKKESGIEVEVIPGCTALNSCASLVGAPLTHDFCSVSLSDLLTPWPVIARRLESAGKGDFVVGLYNPKSGKRSRHIVEAQKILLKHRSPKTPVALVSSAYRNRQSIKMTTLEKMDECDIGMLTTVLIGNSSTYCWEGMMITPRGYTRKYNAQTGDVKDGESAGHSLALGLDGWKKEALNWMKTNGASYEAAAEKFGAPLGEILSGVSQDVAEPITLPTAVEMARAWGNITVTLHGRSGSFMTMTVKEEDLTLADGELLVSGSARIGGIGNAWLFKSDTFPTIMLLDNEGDRIVTLHREVP